ncbi:MAG: ferredoxin-type protein NapF [Gammaproteobacteria bacterium]|nr:ferredoxin-type protein NapF [Gammaproteobacteria bacterium]
MAKSPEVSLSRRNLLRGKFGFARTNTSDAIRLPWSIGEQHFIDHCTRCNECVSACPENIIVKGNGGFPELNFNLGECTFCQECLDSCNEPLFSDPSETKAWLYKAVIDDSCLAKNNVHCQTCQDNCEPYAIAFPPRIGGAPQPKIDLFDCNGCGGCVKSCPSNSIKIILINEGSHE